MVRLENIRKLHPTRQGPVRALDGVSLDVRPGEFLVVRGPSGCGKTTLLFTMGGMLRPTSGTVLVAGADIYALSRRSRAEFRARTVGFVFQMFHLVPYLSVLENVLLAMDCAKPSAAPARARELLTQLGLGARLEHTPAALSAGERQRTALARALLPRPKLILADEPTGNLDPENAAEVFRHLRAFHEAGGTVVVVTHGAEANADADRVVELRAGRLG